MTRSVSQASRARERTRAKSKLWYRAYRSRMDEGYEPCRNRQCDSLATTFAHIIAAQQGGSYVSDNLTLLCPACNALQGTQSWPWLTPLTAEPDFLEVVYGGPERRGGCMVAVYADDRVR